MSALNATLARLSDSFRRMARKQRAAEARAAALEQAEVEAEAEASAEAHARAAAKLVHATEKFQQQVHSASARLLAVPIAPSTPDARPQTRAAHYHVHGPWTWPTH